MACPGTVDKSPPFKVHLPSSTPPHPPCILSVSARASHAPGTVGAPVKPRVGYGFRASKGTQRGTLLPRGVMYSKTKQSPHSLVEPDFSNVSFSSSGMGWVIRSVMEARS